MRLWEPLAWIAGLWLAAGAEAAWGGGMPGPLLLIALTAGLCAGTRAGLLVGVGAGLCDAALCGRDLIPLALLGMLCGGVAGLLPRWFSSRHLLVGMGTAFVMSLGVSLTWAIGAGNPSPAALLAVLQRGGVNVLWMFAIYGIVLVISFRRANNLLRGEY